MALADDASPVFVARGDERVRVDVHRHGQDRRRVPRRRRAVSWGDHHPCLFSRHRVVLPHGLPRRAARSGSPRSTAWTTSWRRARRVADIGCGHGASVVVMARRTRSRKSSGFDFHAPSIETAADTGRRGRGRRRRRRSRSPTPRTTTGTYDLICFFDCLHDMGDPVGIARYAREHLAADGTVLLVEPFAIDGPVARTSPGTRWRRCSTRRRR